jgi:hypothetical protein
MGAKVRFPTEAGYSRGMNHPNVWREHFFLWSEQ